MLTFIQSIGNKDILCISKFCLHVWKAQTFFFWNISKKFWTSILKLSIILVLNFNKWRHKSVHAGRAQDHHPLRVAPKTTWKKFLLAKREIKKKNCGDVKNRGLWVNCNSDLLISKCRRPQKVDFPFFGFPIHFFIYLSWFISLNRKPFISSFNSFFIIFYQQYFMFLFHFIYKHIVDSSPSKINQ